MLPPLCLRGPSCTAILSVEEPSHTTVPPRFQGNKADVPRDLRAGPGNTTIKLHSCVNLIFCQEALVGCQNSCTAILSVVEKIADSEVRYNFIDDESPRVHVKMMGMRYISPCLGDGRNCTPHS